MFTIINWVSKVAKYYFFNIYLYLETSTTSSYTSTTEFTTSISSTDEKYDIIEVEDFPEHYHTLKPNKPKKPQICSEGMSFSFFINLQKFPTHN
jgi:hypothetical protein